MVKILASCLRDLRVRRSERHCRRCFNKKTWWNKRHLRGRWPKKRKITWRESICKCAKMKKYCPFLLLAKYVKEFSV